MAIVEDRARTTRDRLYDVGEWNGRRFLVVDTGGLETHPGDAIEERVQEQARLALSEADVIVFVVDAEAGLTPADFDAAEILRTAKAPVIVAANKADNPKRELEAAEFHALGWPETFAISALHGRGVADVLDVLVWALPPESESELARKRTEAELDEHGPSDAARRGSRLRLRRSAGAARHHRPPQRWQELAAQRPAGPATGDRQSDIPGTTRDAIDTSFEWAGRTVRLVDTAGIRRRGKVASGPAAERFATLRALKAVSRSDVAVLVLDAGDGLTAQDAHVAGYALDEGIGLVVAINKWDVIEKEEHTFDEYVAVLRQEAPYLAFAPIISISAKTGQRVERIVGAALEIAAERRRRIPTAALNAWLRDVTQRRPPPTVRGKQTRFFYATQVQIEPPTFVLFANEAVERPLQLPALPRESAARDLRLCGHSAAADHSRAGTRGARASAAGERSEASRQAEARGHADDQSRHARGDRCRRMGDDARPAPGQARPGRSPGARRGRRRGSS